MLFISLKTQLPEFADVLKHDTADQVVNKLSKDKNKNRLLQFANKIIHSQDWRDNKKLIELARSAMKTLEKSSELRRDDLVFRWCRTAVQSVGGAKTSKPVLPNVQISHITQGDPLEQVKKLGSFDKKNKTHELLSLVSKIVHTVRGWQENEKLVDTVRAGLDYLRENPAICTDKVVYGRCMRALGNFDRAHEEAEAEETEEVLPGIQNIGNSCYVGATLQGLKHSEGFMNALRDKDTPVATKIKEIAKTLTGDDNTAPRTVTKEEMTQFMETLTREGHAEKQGSPGDPADLYSFLATKSDIPQVHYVHPHPQRGEVKDTYLTVLEEEGRNTNVDLDAYIAREHIHFLSQDDLPPLLPVVINKMRKEKQGSLAKIPYEIKIPLLSDVGEEIHASYALKAIVTSGGHAVTWVPVMIEEERKWICYDDAKVTLVDDTEEIRKKIRDKAYVLLFDPIGIK